MLTRERDRNIRPPYPSDTRACIVYPMNVQLLLLQRCSLDRSSSDVGGVQLASWSWLAVHFHLLCMVDRSPRADQRREERTRLQLEREKKRSVKP